MAPAATATVRAIKRDVPFTWEGKDKRGARVKGRSLAPDEAALRAELRRQGVAPSRIRRQRQVGKGGKPTPGDIAVFSRQLATMLAAGIPLVQSFEIVGNGHEKPAMQKLILDVKADVEGGTSLHEALGKHPLYFDDLYAFTQAVINLSKFVQRDGVYIAIVLGLAVYAFIYFKKRSKAMREFLDRLSLKIPVIGPILNKAAIARYARTLSTMFAAGVP